MYQISPSIFREYDIRGIFGETLFTPDAYKIAQKYAAFLGWRKKIAVGRDGRLSSPELAESLISGLLDAGFDVVDIGICPSPMLYFSVFHLNLDGGIMVTGSHNPPEHNGFKMLNGKNSLFGEDIKKLALLNNHPSEIKGKKSEYDIKTEYANRLILDLKSLPSNLKIGWDSGNGAAGEIIELLTRKISAQHFAINTKIDGKFPNHHPDPSDAKNLAQLQELVKSNKLDVGFAFDGDGDRLGVVDDKGRIFWGDMILAVLARTVLQENPNATIIADVKSSSVFETEVTRLGGKPMLWKTGHSLIKAKMKELGAPLAGEMSAHIFFADKYYGFDDGIYAALRFLNVMASSGLKTSELYDSLPQTFSSTEYRIECADDKKFKIIEQIKSEIIIHNSNILDIDGIRVTKPYGWWLARASNTGGYIVVRWEANSPENYKILESEVRQNLKKFGLKIS